jgi:hypothetical protein
VKVRDLIEIAFKHGAIAGEAKRPAVVVRVIVNESVQIVPILPIEAGNVGSVRGR